MSQSPLITTEWILPNGLRSGDVAPAQPVPASRQAGGDKVALHPLQQGAFLLDVQNHFHVPITVGAKVGIEQPMMALRLPSRGRTFIRRAGVPDMEETDDHWNLVLTADASCRVDHRPGTPHRSLSLVVPVARLRAALGDQEVPGPIRRFLEGGRDPFGAIVRTSPAMHAIAGQIRSNPYTAGLAALYREGKVLELLAEAFTALADRPGTARSSPFSGRDRRRALAARDILMANLSDPPTIEDLARQVGTSQRRLIESFHVVFGVTPLKCLVAWRLEQARRLLTEEELSVKQVAMLMGYAHASSFSQAYTRQFGSPPRRRSGR